MTASAPHLQRVDVCLTVDVEFSINRSLTRPGHQPIGAEWVYGWSADGRSQGLGFLLDCLDAHGCKGTFFVEVFNTWHFGDGPMQRIVQELLARGQDVQMHMHPVWLYFRHPHLREQLARGGRPQDTFTNRTAEEIAGWLTDGTEILTRLCGSTPIAFRSGNLNAGRVLYQGMARAGLYLASNIGVGLSPPAEPELAFTAGIHRIEGVTEVPVTSYRVPFTRDRLLLLTITGSSFTELCSVLGQAARLGVGPVVILLHPHDFHIPTRDDPTRAPVFRPDPLRQRRLQQLCAWLAARPERYQVTTFAEAAARWRQQRSSALPMRPLSASTSGLAMRFWENRLLPAITADAR